MNANSRVSRGWWGRAFWEGCQPDDEGWELKKTLQSSRLIPLLSYPPIRMGKLRTTERKALVQDPAINQCKLPPICFGSAFSLACHSFSMHLPVPTLPLAWAFCASHLYLSTATRWLLTSSSSFPSPATLSLPTLLPTLTLSVSFATTHPPLFNISFPFLLEDSI